MNYTEIKTADKEIKSLTEMGAILVAALEKFVASEGLMHILNPEKRPGKRKLLVSFNGLQMKYCVEAAFSVNPIARLAAYYLTYDVQPKELLLTECSFSGCGEAMMFDDQRSNPFQFAPYFLAKVFTAIQAQELKLRP